MGVDYHLIGFDFRVQNSPQIFPVNLAFEKNLQTTISGISQTFNFNMKLM